MKIHISTYKIWLRFMHDVITFSPMQNGRGQWAVYYTCPQGLH